METCNIGDCSRSLRLAFQCIIVLDWPLLVKIFYECVMWAFCLLGPLLLILLDVDNRTYFFPWSWLKVLCSLATFCHRLTMLLMLSLLPSPPPHLPPWIVGFRPFIPLFFSWSAQILLQYIGLCKILTFYSRKHEVVFVQLRNPF